MNVFLFKYISKVWGYKLEFNNLTNALKNLSSSVSSENNSFNNLSFSGKTKVRKLDPSEDSLKNKKFIYLDEKKYGIVEVVDHTAEQNSKYFVVFKSGVVMPTEALVTEMKEFDTFIDKTKGLEDDILNKPISEVIKQNTDFKVLDKVPEYHEVFGKMGLGFLGDDVQVLNKEDISNIEDISKNKATNTNNNIKNNQFKDDPFNLIFSKIKKSEVYLNILFNIPKNIVLNSILENFEFENLEDKIYNFIITNNLEDIKNSIKNAITEYYKIKKQDESTEN
jgi:hypothetical protein